MIVVSPPCTLCMYIHVHDNVYILHDYTHTVYIYIQCSSSTLPAVVPDDETFRVKVRKSSTLPFSGRCLLEILRFHLMHSCDCSV